MGAQSLLQDTVGLVGDFLLWMSDTLNDPQARAAVVGDLGGDPEAAKRNVPQFPANGLQSVRAYREAAEPEIESFLSAVNDLRNTFEALRPLGEAVVAGDGDRTVDEGIRAILDLMALNYWKLRFPRSYFAAQVLSFGEEATSVYGSGGTSYGRFGRALGAVFEFILGPFDTWDDVDLGDETDAQQLSDRSLQPVAAMLAFVSFFKAKDVLYGWDVVPGVPPALGEPPAAPTAADRALARMLTMKFGDADKDGPDALLRQALVSLSFVPGNQGGKGIFLSLGGGYQVDVPLEESRWSVIFDLNAASAVAALIGNGSDGFQFATPGDASDFRATLAFEARPEAGERFSHEFKIMKGTGLKFGLVRIEAGLNSRSAQLKATFRDSEFSIAPKSFDGFIGKLMPGDGVRLPFDFAVGVDSDRGAFLEGLVPVAGAVNTQSSPAPAPTAGTPAPAPATAPAGVARSTAAPAPQPPPLPPLPNPEPGTPGLSLRIPLGKTLGPVTVHDIGLALRRDGADDEKRYLLEATTSLSAKIGPVVTRVDRIGLRFGLLFPKEGQAANLGVVDLDIGVRPPDGVALAVDAKGIITGGGFLFHDRVQALYAGALQLTIQDRFTVKAFGLLATKMPDGSPGYSLIVFITADDFRPYPLGMGFRLLGFGGMLAIHRTFDEDAMRAGLANNTLGTLLFPKDMLRRAPEIVRNLQQIFPARRDSHMAGLLAKIGWSTPTMVLMELALIYEWGNRHRLIILGRISARLPSQKNDLVRLNLDALGLIDFDQGNAAADAVLVDSRLAGKFVLTGAAAMRMHFGRGPGTGFAIAVGGFNPRFAAPLGMPKLARVAINLSSGDNPRLVCEAYVALTPNTVQFGARAQFYAAAYGFSVAGDVGFDVLVQLLPFHFIADVHADFQLKRGSRNLFKVSFKGELEGPLPLRVAGKASFEILWCDFSIRFDKTLVAGRPPLPPAIDALLELRTALSDAANWNAELLPGIGHGVSLRKPAAGAGLQLDPLGVLTVRQNVAPLNTTRPLDTFGGAPLAGERNFRITAAQIGGSSQTATPVQDQFAPAQFFAMSDDDKLASPSFAELDSGVAFGSAAVAFDAGLAVASPLEFEDIVVDAQHTPPPEPPPRYVLSAERFAAQLRFGAVAQAGLRRSGMARFRDEEAEPAVRMQAPGVVAAATGDLQQRAPGLAAGSNWVEAQAVVAALNRSAGTPRWQLVAAHELLQP